MTSSTIVHITNHDVGNSIDQKDRIKQIRLGLLIKLPFTKEN
jgi:hypothetical protein